MTNESVAARLLQPITQLSLELPQRALTRLSLRLRQGRQTGEAWDASLAFRVPLDALAALLDYWCDEFDYRAAEARLNQVGLFASEEAGPATIFSHARSSEAGAMPLLLLHGRFGSPAEFAQLLGPLTDPRAHGGARGDAFHVVCPALPGFGLSSHGERDVVDVARSCSQLMAGLGYRRYLAYGSDLGAGVVRALIAHDAGLAGALISRCPSYPTADPFELITLTTHDKSRLALLDALAGSAAFPEPTTPIELLAAALTQLADADLSDRRLCDELLFGLSLSCSGGEPAQQRLLVAQSDAEHFGASKTPLGVCTFPLEAPSLRRFAERHHRVVSWTEHESGGSLPALEQPTVLLSELRSFFARFR